MKKYLSLLLLVIVLALLIFAYFKEKHVVYMLDDSEKDVLDGYSFTETTTYDGLMLNKKDGKVYDVYSLTPAFLQEKDRPT